MISINRLSPLLGMSHEPTVYMKRAQSPVEGCILTARISKSPN